MGVLASQIIQDFQPAGVVNQLFGEDVRFESILPVSSCTSTDLVFADDQQYLAKVIEKKPAITVTQEPLVQPLVKAGITVITSTNVKLAQALLRQKYTDKKFHESEWGDCHSSAIIHHSAIVPTSCVIGPGVIIGKEARLGERCVLMANTVIEHNTTIDDNTIVHPNVTVGWGTKIGQRVFLKSGCVIGSEGYGYAQDKNGKSYRIPQQGIVVIEDDCTIGANNCIDRATYDETRIGAGCKLDNLIHIAHNVTLGKDCLLLAQTVVAGSTQLGDRVIASGQTGILDHLKITNDVVLLHRAGVTQNVLESGMYGYLPLQPLKTYLKNIAVFKKLAELKKMVNFLEKKILQCSEKKPKNAKKL